MGALLIGVVGDRNDKITAHQAIPQALSLAAERLDKALNYEWLATDSIVDTKGLGQYDALWCAPGSPYRSMEGALLAIRYAREMRIPFLGTCGGFQHAVIEYARNVIGWADADHGETSPDAPRAVVTSLACPLVESYGEVRFTSGSRIAAAYGGLSAKEGYHCSFGLNPLFIDDLLRGALRATACAAAGDVRAVELDDHPFFVCTLFQPERSALVGTAPPLTVALVQVASGLADVAAGRK